MKAKYLALLLPFLFLLSACAEPTNPKYKLAQVVQVNGTTCKGTVIEARWVTRRSGEWHYRVAFELQCVSCNGDPEFLQTVQVVEFPESKLSSAQPFIKTEEAEVPVP